MRDVIFQVGAAIVMVISMIINSARGHYSLAFFAGLLALYFVMRAAQDAKKVTTPKTKKRYVYFVSYRGPNTFGRCEISRDIKIQTWDDVEKMEKALNESHGLPWTANSNVGQFMIVNYQLMRVDDVQLDPSTNPH